MTSTAFRRLPARYNGIVMPLILTALMTFVVSGISTVRALGFTAEAMQSWPSAWGLSWIVAFPTLVLILPFVRRLVALVVAPPG